MALKSFVHLEATLDFVDRQAAVIAPALQRPRKIDVDDDPTQVEEQGGYVLRLRHRNTSCEGFCGDSLLKNDGLLRDSFAQCGSLDGYPGLLQDFVDIRELDSAVVETHYLVALQLIDQARDRFGPNADQFGQLTAFYRELDDGISIFVPVAKTLVEDQYEVQKSRFHAHGQASDIVAFGFRGIVAKVL
jgi:hypothetical protein